MTRNSPGGSADPGLPTLTAFLARARRRRLAAALLVAALPAALLNEAVRWGAIGAARWLTWPVPVLDVGPLVLLALVPVLLRRWNPAAVAAATDGRLGLRDRLTSFVDFRVRRGIADEVRVAQAAETARLLARFPMRIAAPLGPWLAAGPVLLTASLLYPLFTPNAPRTLTVQIAGRLVPGGTGRTPGPESAGDPGAPAEPGPGPGENGPGERPAGAARPTPPGDAAGPGADRKPVASQGAAADQKSAAQPGTASGSADQGPSPRRPPKPETGGEQRSAQEPSHITSERVGTALARVVDPLVTATAGTSPPPPPVAGTFSFRLLPKSAPGEGAGGDRPAETDRPERVTVDLDVLPEQYRAVVRTYFGLLAEERDGDGLSNTPPDQETTR